MNSVTSYFEKRRAFATGIAVCGSGIGTAIMSPLIEYIINLYGWKGAMLIISALLINCTIFGALFKPVPLTLTPSSSSIPPIDISTTIDTIQTSNSNQHSNRITNDDDNDNQIELNNESMLICLENSKSLQQQQSSMEIHTQKSTTGEESLNDDDFIVKQRSYSFTPGFLYREDSFYSGSLMNINNNKSDGKFSNSTNNNNNHYRMERINKHKTNSDCYLFKKFNFPDEIKENFCEMIDLSLMRNEIFLIFSVSNFLTSIGYHIPFIFLKDWIVDNRIGSPQETGFFTSIIGLFSTISRLVFGYISDHSFVNRLWLYTISVTFCGIVIISNTVATTYKLLAIFCAFFGITCGMFFGFLIDFRLILQKNSFLLIFKTGTYVSLTSVVLVDLLSLEKLTNAFGLILLFQGVASILGPLFIG